MMPCLKQRGEFVRAATSGFHASAPGLVLQAYKRGELPDQAGPARIGFTTSKKVGKAVQRNRARRRLRVLAETILAAKARPGVDYVLIGRTATVDRPFADLMRDLEHVIERVHSGRARAAKPRRPRGGRNATAAKPS